MSIGYVRALRILHGAFSHYPPRHRVHMLIRFLTCPFLRTIDEIQPGARVLDLGSGHGLYARLLTEERAREVIAVEPDLRKSLLPSPSSRIRKVAGYDDCVRGTFDAAVMFDVVYLLTPDARRALFGRVFDRLRPGGRFVLKDMDPSHRLKMRWARLQERLSETFLGITLGHGFVAQSKEEVTAMLAEAGFVGIHARRIDRGYPHPHLIYTASRPE